MKVGTAKRLGLATAVLAVLVLLPGQAGADPAPPTFTISGGSAAEGGVATFTITRSGSEEDLATESTVKASTPGGSDHDAKEESIPFAAGENTKSFTVQTKQDDLDEPDETFVVTLEVLANGTPGSQEAVGTITDDDAKPTLAISGPSSVNEAGNATYEIAMTGKSGSDVSVSFATGGGNASAGADYSSASGTRTWPSGDTGVRTLTVPILSDALDEANETFNVVLSDPTAADIAVGSVTTAITDNDDEPVVSIGDKSVTEGNTGTVDAVVTLTLSPVSGRSVTVPYATAPGTAGADEDYVPATSNVVFAAGETSKTITVQVKGDTKFEPDEKFSVVLTDPDNASLGAKNVGEITITNDDTGAKPSVPNASVAEGNTGTTDLTFQVTLPGPRPATTFNYRTVAGSADGSDYVEVGGAQLSFPAAGGSGSTTLPVTITLKGDALDELDETLTLELLNPTTGAVVVAATGTINNDDNNTDVVLPDASADEPTVGDVALKFTVSLTPVSGRAVNVNWSTADGTATAGVDYTAASGTLAFAPGEVSKDVLITVAGDTLKEENETVLLNISGGGANFSDSQALGTIVDKNAPPSLSVSDPLAREGAGAEFTVTLAGTTLSTVTVRFSTRDGSATGADYVSRVGTLTFAPGEKAKTLAVTVLDDDLPETSETFSLNLAEPVNATIVKSRGIATIEASDLRVTVSESPSNVKPPTTKPPAPVRILPSMTLGPRVVTIRSGVAQMLVTCRKTSKLTCTGTVVLESATKPKRRYGAQRFTVKKGKKAFVRIRLSAASMKLLQTRGTLRAKALVTVKTSTKNLTVSPGVITLKRGATTTAKPAAPKEPRAVIDP